MQTLNDVTAVILAGGLGTRLREETEFKPKPLVQVGGHPILWHIMKNLSSQGITNFIICTGYKGQAIKEYFYSYGIYEFKMNVKMESKSITHFVGEGENPKNWNITIVDTGELTPTGGRIKQISTLIKDENFFVTYGDGLADVNLQELYNFHISNNLIGTVTSVQPTSRFGVLDINPNGIVRQFREKPKMDTWINAGFFFFKKKFFEYLEMESTLENEPLRELVNDSQLGAFQHEGFWQPMDTYRESQLLNKLWEENSALWKNWS